MSYMKTTLLKTILYLNFLTVTPKFWSLSSETVWTLHAIYSICCLAYAGCLLLPFFLVVLPVTPSSFSFIQSRMMWHPISVTLQPLLRNTDETV